MHRYSASIGIFLFLMTILPVDVSAQGIFGPVPQLATRDDATSIFGPVPNIFALLSEQRDAVHVPFPLSVSRRSGFLRRPLFRDPTDAAAMHPLGVAPVLDTSRMLEWVPRYGFEMSR